MAGHQHDRCVKPRATRRRRGSVWVCDCGKQYALIGKPRWPTIDPDGEREWAWTEQSRATGFAQEHHIHDWYTDHIQDLYDRVNALENPPKKKKKNV